MIAATRSALSCADALFVVTVSVISFLLVLVASDARVAVTFTFAVPAAVTVTALSFTVAPVVPASVTV